MDVTLTVLYALLFIDCLYVPIDLYATLRNDLPSVAKILKPYFVWIIVLSEVAVFSRMVFISITDVNDNQKIINHSDTSLHWPGLILGSIVSESVAIICIIILVLLTWRMEQLLNAFFLHGSKLLV